MKILISDVFLRKTFDIINIIKHHYPNNDIIYTSDSTSWVDILKLRLLYGNARPHLLRKGKFFNDDLKIISKIYINEPIVYLPIEEDTTKCFLEFTQENGNLNFHFLLPDLSNFELARNKLELNKYCSKNGFPCPLLISESEFKERKFTYPIIKKPNTGSGSEGIEYINNEDGLSDITINFKMEFIQERLPYPGQVEAGFFIMKDGKLKGYYSHQRIRTFPVNGGVTVFSKADFNKEIKVLGTRLLETLNWSGFAMIEYIFDERDCKYKLIEINPRLWGSVLLSEFCGANFIVKYINLSLNTEVDVLSQINTNAYIRWIFPYEVFYWLRKISNPFNFFKSNSNTCYINRTYTSFFRSFLFIVITYLNPIKNKKKILKWIHLQ